MRRVSAIILLLFIAASAFYGGFNLMQDPTGQSVGFSSYWMRFDLFNSYLIPGIILFFVIGIGSLVAAIMAFVFAKKYPLAIIVSGSAIVIWITAQLFIMQKTSFLQPLIGCIGVILFILGLLDRRIQVKALHPA